jgi:ATP-dependent protease ClpP protease subunit
MITATKFQVESEQESTSRTFFTEKSSKVYEHYLDYEFSDFSQARELCYLLRCAEAEDEVILRINSLGGRFDIAAQIINSIKDCKGLVTGIIEQECASAATMVFLACDKWQVHRWGEMMVHYVSYGASGKGHEIAAKIAHNNKIYPKMMKEIYKDFLTEEEIEDVIRGNDLYLTPIEIEARLKNVVKCLTEEMEDDESQELEETDQFAQVFKDIKPQ